MADSFTAKPPEKATGVLVLDDGTVLWGQGFGAAGSSVGEICFNTAMTGYQEILTDPSYAGQIITFTFPHIGICGANPEDIEAPSPAARGLIVREAMTESSNWRARETLESWLKTHKIPGLCGIDTRALTRRIRDRGAPNGVICHAPDGKFDLEALKRQAKGWPGLEGMDLAKDVTCAAPYEWDEMRWSWPLGYGRRKAAEFHVVAMDYGAKRNILRCLASAGCRVTVVPAMTGYEDIMRLAPDGVFLSNGPGDPAETGKYAVPVIRKLVEAGMPVFGICLGHQMLALALGGRTEKMRLGHRGANHPVRDLLTGKVEITSQNHGFMVIPESLPSDAEVTHISLFDGSNEGLRSRDKPLFSVQYHPEASPGPQDSHYLFERFVTLMREHAGAAKARERSKTTGT